ncbi:hypothetical protein L249_7277, partial [Ophiocordyceps polyrhachis-furcata BCC 54312]
GAEGSRPLHSPTTTVDFFPADPREGREGGGRRQLRIPVENATGIHSTDGAGLIYIATADFACQGDKHRHFFQTFGGNVVTRQLADDPDSLGPAQY